MKAPVQDLTNQYRAALEDYLAGAGESALQQAYELGRAALNDGFGVLDMTAIQCEALIEVLRARRSNGNIDRILEAARNFMVESLSPFEMTHRGFREDNVALRRLNERLNEQMEDQAKKIGQTLHDEAGQLLTAVHIALAGMEREVTSVARKQIEEVDNILKQVEEHMRRLSHEFRPRILDDIGIMPALDFLARGVSGRNGIAINVEGTKDQRFSPMVETVLYRTVQEALTNAAKHAKGTRATVKIVVEPKAVQCSIRDDGIGFDLQSLSDGSHPNGLGLRGIQERLAALGGTLQITSSPGQGTELLAYIPLKNS
jgi:signal transduction histidine kinase